MSSKNIKEAKEKKVFLYRLHSNKALVTIDSFTKDSIQEAWVEHLWQYKDEDFSKTVEKDSAIRIAIRFKTIKSSTDIWVKHKGEKLGWWSGHAFGEFDLSYPFYLVENHDNQDKVLDSFYLRKYGSP